jgi:hypothetical protein
MARSARCMTVLEVRMRALLVAARVIENLSRSP